MIRESATADRYRDRIRMRVSAQVQAAENISVGIGFATGEGGDPRSTNQTLGDVFSGKSLDLDLAYFSWAIRRGVQLIGGKMKQPFFKPGQSLFWDDDVNPEGLALTFERGVLFGSAYSYWVDEFSAPENERTSDTMLFGGQIGARLPLGESNLVLAAHYYVSAPVRAAPPSSMVIRVAIRRSRWALRPRPCCCTTIGSSISWRNSIPAGTLVGAPCRCRCGRISHRTRTPERT